MVKGRQYYHDSACSVRTRVYILCIGAYTDDPLPYHMVKGRQV